MMKFARSVALVATVVSACVTTAWASKIDPALLVPEVSVLIDTSQPKFGEDQSNFPRDNRGIALSPNGRYMYLGYNNSRDPISGANRQGEVRRVDLQTGVIDAFDQRVVGLRGKSISVDDKGRVYIAENANIHVFDQNLSPLLTFPTGTNSEGIEVRRVGSDLFAFTSDRTAGGGVTKWKINEGAGVALNSAAKDNSFGVLGTAAIPTSFSLRGLDVDSQGNIWVADFGNPGGAQPGQVFSVPASGIGAPIAHSFGVNSMVIDVAINPDASGDQILVSGFMNLTLRMFDTGAFPTSVQAGDGFSFVVPWATLGLDPDGNNQGLTAGALSGIAVVPNRGFYVTNEAGQTFGEKSTYGITDAHTANGFQDNIQDDNEPVLGFLIPVTVPEPAALALGSFALLGFVIYVRRQRQLQACQQAAHK